MSQKKENKPCNGQFSKEAGQQKKGRKQNSGFGAGQEKGGSRPENKPVRNMAPALWEKRRGRIMV